MKVCPFGAVDSIHLLPMVQRENKERIDLHAFRSWHAVDNSFRAKLLSVVAENGLCGLPLPTRSNLTLLSTLWFWRPMRGRKAMTDQTNLSNITFIKNSSRNGMATVAQVTTDIRDDHASSCGILSDGYWLLIDLNPIKAEHQVS